MSTNRIRPDAGDAGELPKGPSGMNLCRWCSTECRPPKSRTFCSPECIHEWRLRTQPAYVRLYVWIRDRGVCALCRLACTRVTYAGPWSLERYFAPFHGPSAVKTLTPWDADHIVPVVEGGGECGLEGYRTLCRPCHKAVTAQLAKRRAAARRASA